MNNILVFIVLNMNNKINVSITVIIILCISICYFIVSYHHVHQAFLPSSQSIILSDKNIKKTNNIIVEHDNHRQLQAFTPNYAPKMSVDASLCKQPMLWGRAHAGGWEICGDSSYLNDMTTTSSTDNECIVYSYGLGADWSFDNAAELYGCEVHGFDPTGKLWRDGMHGDNYNRIDYAKQYPSSKKHFHNYGLGAASRAIYPIASVPQLWPGLGDPQLSKTNTELWEMRSFMQAFVDLDHLQVMNVPHPVTGSQVIIRRITINNSSSYQREKGPLGLRPRIRSSSSLSSSSSSSSSRAHKEVDKYVDTTFATQFHIMKIITVLKVDVEGAEWDAFGAMLYMDTMVDVLKKGMIRQLLVEWHWDPDSRARNGRHSQIMARVEELGFKPWKINRHEGSDCCLDMSYVWVDPSKN